MSLAGFQDAFARLVSEAGFAASVRDGAQVDGLTEREHARLVAAARDPGLDAATTVHVGWRLSKLLALLPLTRAALGPDMAALARAFWARRPPRTLYFQSEAIEFCRFMATADGVAPAVREVAAFEAASIELDMGLDGGGADRVELQLAHDPQALIATVASPDPDLDSVPIRPATVIGRRGDGEPHRWSFVSTKDASLAH